MKLQAERGLVLETLRKAEKKVDKIDKSVEKVPKIDKAEKAEKKLERSPVVTTICTTPTPVMEVQELRKSLTAATEEVSDTSVVKSPSAASRVTPPTGKTSSGKHRESASTTEVSTPGVLEEDNPPPLQAPPKRLSVDVRRLEMGECLPLSS